MTFDAAQSARRQAGLRRRASERRADADACSDSGNEPLRA